MNDTFLMASTSSITLQSLGKIVQRAPAVGAIKHGVCMFVFCRVPRAAHCSLKGDIFWTGVVSRFMGQFWYCLQCFFSIDCPFKCTR